MVNELIHVGRRVVHKAGYWRGIIIDRFATAQGRQLASVIIEGQDAPRIFDAAVLLAA